MNPDASRLHLHSTQSEELSAQHAELRSQAREFASVEEMIRADREQTEVPGHLAERVNASLNDMKPPRQPWWRRFFGHP